MRSGRSGRSTGSQSVGEGADGALIVNFRGDLGALRRALSAGGWSVNLSGDVLRISRGAVAAPPARAARAAAAPAPAPAPAPAQ